ncbi:MAG: LysR family transcriptional regulator [Bacteroides sp.]|nr:LysR family transcriptional regulator [Prevotella sp.]MCM1407812.1 LysR family transcriptional regulator [Treponema brennaborense]MCM1468840.1 LysR family transcriptional regulator [Bacteroides sp.]
MVFRKTKNEVAMYSRELDTFIAVADCGSFLKASEKLYYTTPATVMNRMNKLEQTVGVKLFERTNQGVYLTAAGHSLYQDAVKIIEQSNAAIERARKAAESEQEVIRVGTSILRPCKTLVDLWAKIDDGNLPFRIQIVPIDDEPNILNTALNKQIDCFVTPCDASDWQENFNILLLEYIPCRIAVPRKHRLAKKRSLCWADLDGENFMILKQGLSAVLDKMRRRINLMHPNINIIDAPSRYDTSVFNECERMNCLMETLDIWKDIHPSLITLPMRWNYKMPYGVVYAKKPTAAVQNFIDKIALHL